MTGPTRAQFEALLHQELTVHPPGGGATTTLTLAAIEPVVGAKDPQSFALIFQGPLAGTLSQGTFLVEHAQLARDAIFLVPLAPAGGRALYEATFNRG